MEIETPVIGKDYFLLEQLYGKFTVEGACFKFTLLEKNIGYRCFFKAKFQFKGKKEKVLSKPLQQEALALPGFPRGFVTSASGACIPGWGRL
jgi:hypothetical protein